MSKFISELSRRGLIQDCTVSLDELHNHFGDDSVPVKFYIGFDPTADSLHVGSLQQLVIMDLARFYGHTPICLMGGSTASIGDPSFRNDMRPMMTDASISKNIESLMKQVGFILDPAHFVNNIDWTRNINILDFLREFGPHFSVNKMLSFSSVKDRLGREGSGLSVLEFSYSMLQAMDFLHLNRVHNVTVQIGGSDQWSNIIQGVELVHKVDKKKVIGITTPLLLKSDGTKMGKTATGAIWLDKEKTSVFDFFQFWRNLSDSEMQTIALRFMGINLSDIGIDINELKNKVSLDLVRFVHGADEHDNLVKNLNNNNAGNELSVPKSEVNTIFDVLLKCGLFSSKSEIRRMIKYNENMVINGNKIISEEMININVESGEIFDITKGRKSRVFVKIV